MTYNKTENITAKAGEPKPEGTLSDKQEPLLNALVILLSDVCLTRLDLFLLSGIDPSEAAKEVIESLDRYDFLSGSVMPETRYQELKGRVESSVGDRAEKVISEQNPR